MNLLARLAIGALLSFGSLRFASAQNAGQPIYLPIEKFGFYSTSLPNEPDFMKQDATHNQSRVSNRHAIPQAIDDKIRSQIPKLPSFPRYLYSGCDDRAHATWLSFSSDVRPHLMKIWVVTPAKYTETIPGFIHSTRVNDPLYSAVNWGFHVALAFYAPNTDLQVTDPQSGLRVIDEALRPGEVIVASDWFREMETSPLTFWTLTTGDVYQFNPVPEKPHEGAVNDPEWNALHYGYEGPSLSQNWIPMALARDAVGVLAMKGAACPALNAIATNSGSILAKLQAGVGDQLPSDCQVGVDLFKKESSRWAGLLKQASD